MKKMRFNVVALLLAVAALALTGCKEEAGLKFSHALHADEAQCSDCHRADQPTLRTGMEPCMECHEIDQSNPSKECLTCHTVGEKEGYKVGQADRGASYADVTFDHDAHEDVECATCHEGGVSATSLCSTDFFPGMDLCTSCHDGDPAPAQCATCHEKLREDVKPRSHTVLWPESHGDFDDASCTYCHEGTDPCMGCHREAKPRSHTAGWKVKSHGLEARLDRRDCNVCHTATYCSECHSNPPRSHIPAPLWRNQGHRVEGSIDSDSCAVCHTANQASCAVCHTTGF